MTACWVIGPLFALALAPEAWSADEIPMFPAPRFTAGEGAWHAAVADFDGDGVPDVVTSNFLDDTLTLLRGVGDVTFLAPEVVGTAAYPAGIAAGDVNADGTMDFVVANTDADVVTVHLGRGHGAFDPGVPFAVGETPKPLALADLNADGLLDIVVGNVDDGSTMSLLGDGNGGFVVAGTSVTGRWPEEIVVADVNQDGLPDVVVPNSLDENVAVLIGRGDGQFAKAVLYDVGLFARGAGVGDLNDDGTPDLVIAAAGASGGNGATYVRLGAGDGTFGPATDVTGEGATGVTLADVDADGDLDLVCARKMPSKAEVAVFANTGTGQFALFDEVGVGPPPEDLILADLDGDGTLDLISTTLHFTPTPHIGAVRGVGDGTFDDASVLFTHLKRLVVLADLDGDGIPDLAVGRTIDPAVLEVMPGVGDGTFGPPVVALNASIGAPARTPDLDGDGLPDLVAAAFPGAVKIAKGHGDLTFTSVQDLDINININGLLVTDLSGDGAVDLALVQSTGTIDIYLGNGDGTFPPSPDQVLSVKKGFEIRGGDINGDGLVDLVIGHGIGRDFTTVLGVGSGAFGVPNTPPSTGINSLSLDLADLDADGVLDVVVARNTHVSISAFGIDVFAGQGDGTFIPTVSLLPGTRVSRLRLMDMDHDGALDIVCGLAHEGGGRLLAVASGGGDGTFEAPRLYGLPFDANRMVFDDMNGDGWTDIALPRDNHTMLLLNRAADPWSHLGQGLAGAAGVPQLLGAGTLAASTPVSLDLSSAPHIARTWLVIGLSELGTPFKGGTLVPAVDVLLGPFLTNETGLLSVASTWPAIVPGGTQVWFQEWIEDATGPAGFSASNGLMGTTP